ncbi:MAG: cupin domain-containing protein [Chloroflexota bacterium]|nr:cupin domain-containing protein [Chloroflexota bacterium]
MSAGQNEKRNAAVYGPEEGEVLGPLRVLAQSPDHPISVTEQTIPPGFPGPVRHRHARMHDIFYVLAGALTLHLDGQTTALTPGSFAIVPPGVVHTFSNPGSEPVRFLTIYHPAGLEQYVKEVARRMGQGSQPSREEMAEIASRYDFEPVPEG